MVFGWRGEEFIESRGPTLEEVGQASRGNEEGFCLSLHDG
jgi:hypothetical protein